MEIILRQRRRIPSTNASQASSNEASAGTAAGRTSPFNVALDGHLQAAEVRPDARVTIVCEVALQALDHLEVLARASCTARASPPACQSRPPSVEGVAAAEPEPVEVGVAAALHERGEPVEPAHAKRRDLALQEAGLGSGSLGQNLAYHSGASAFCFLPRPGSSGGAVCFEPPSGS